jgi:hypothetical protein
VNAHVLGVVLNEVNPRNRRYGYYYHRYYSKYSYEEKSDRNRGSSAAMSKTLIGN